MLLRQGLVDRRRLAQTPSDAWLEALTLPARAAASVAGLRRMLTAVRGEATTVETEVQVAAAADPIATALQQIPGIGPVLSLMIRAEVGTYIAFPGRSATLGRRVPSNPQAMRRVSGSGVQESKRASARRKVNALLVCYEVRPYSPDCHVPREKRNQLQSL